MAETDTSSPTPRLGATRIAVGLAQGIALYALSEIRRGPLEGDSGRLIFGALAMTMLFAPIVLLGGLGALRQRTLALWMGGAVALLAVVGGYDGYIHTVDPARQPQWPEPPVLLLAPAGLFIAHYLILAADIEARWFPSYRRYFELASKDAVRLALTAGFVGALWGLLFLGAGLFRLIDISFVLMTIQKAWFAFPATCTFIAIGVHLTDVRESLVQGVRGMGLTLLSWLTPVMVVITTAFLIALLFTGLEPLWATKRAGGILLGAAAALIVLLNAAYQDGEPAETSIVLKWAERAGAVLLVPLTGLAALAVGLRVAQYGLTPERTMAAACVLVAACFAVGYAIAGVRRGPWLKGVGTTNLVSAYVVLVVLALLLTPIADPARLSVASQMARLKAARVSAEKLDYVFLRFDAGRYGLSALKRLAGQGEATAARLARNALGTSERGEVATPPPLDRAVLIKAGPGSAPLPRSFMDQRWSLGDDPFRRCEGPNQGCMAWITDLDGAPGDEVMLLVAGTIFVYRQGPSGWAIAGAMSPAFCDGVPEALRAGKFRLVPPTVSWRDIEVGGRLLRIQEEGRYDCAKVLAK
ncbi:MAG: DUF4153 domain-containing protein [Caulobacteraceae bacterium]